MSQLSELTMSEYLTMHEFMERTSVSRTAVLAATRMPAGKPGHVPHVRVVGRILIPRTVLPSGTLLGVPEIVRAHRLLPREVYAAVASGALSGFRVGRQYRFAESAVKEWLEGRTL